MSVDRLSERFRDDAQQRRTSLLPYFTAGYPDMAVTEALIQRADALGVAAVEIGEPYSDSIADGPVIQNSFYAALAAGHGLQDTFDMVRRLRPRVRCGLISMVSFSIVHRHGMTTFFQDAADAGFDGVIIPDAPLEESAAWCAAAERANLCHIGLVSPATTPDRARRIAEAASGFVYALAVAGTTGERAAVSPAVRTMVESLRGWTGLPICVGFGVSGPAQVRAIGDFADGVIVGSAIVRRLTEGLAEGLSAEALVDVTAAFVGELQAAGTR